MSHAAKDNPIPIDAARRGIASRPLRCAGNAHRRFAAARTARQSNREIAATALAAVLYERTATRCMITAAARPLARLGNPNIDTERTLPRTDSGRIASPGEPV